MDQNNHVKSVTILARIYTLYFISLACLVYVTHRSLFSHGGESVTTIKTFMRKMLCVAKLIENAPIK